MNKKLHLHKGGLLLVDGSLAVSKTCCCEQPSPSDCPPCCVRIDWGEFLNDSSTLTGEFDVGGRTFSASITVPTPGSRIVCHGGVITVEVESTDGLEFDGGVIRWGPAWESSGMSPLGTAYENKYGIADWKDSSEEKYSATLSFNKCYLDHPQNFAFVKVGSTYPEFFEELFVSRCANDLCCEESGPQCSPCCNKLVLDGVIKLGNGEYVSVEHAADTTTMIFFSLPEGKVCEGDTLGLDILVIPKRHLDAPHNIGRLEIQAGHPWKIEGGMPFSWEELKGPPTNGIFWEPAEGYEFTANAVYSCPECNEDEDTDIDPATPITIVGGTNAGAFPIAVQGGIDFEPCSLIYCCCPSNCRCGCIWPIPDEFCDEANEETDENRFQGLWIPGIVTIKDFTIHIVATGNIFRDGTASELTIAQSGDSRQYGVRTLLPNGKCCPRTTEIVFPATETSNAGGFVSGGWVSVVLTGDCERPLTVAFLQLGNSEAQQRISEASLDGCDTIEFSDTEESVEFPGEFYTWTITGTITGSESCDCMEDEE